MSNLVCLHSPVLLSTSSRHQLRPQVTHNPCECGGGLNSPPALCVLVAVPGPATSEQHQDRDVCTAVMAAHSTADSSTALIPFSNEQFTR